MFNFLEATSGRRSFDMGVGKMRRAILICVAAALLTGGGILLAWKMNSRSVPARSLAEQLTQAKIAEESTVKPAAKPAAKPAVKPAAKPVVLPRPVQVVKSARPALQPMAVTTKPADHRPRTVTTKPADHRPATVTTKPADNRPVAVAIKPAKTKATATKTKPAPAKKQLAVAVVAKPAKVKPTPPLQLAQAVEIEDVPARPVAVAAAPKPKPVKAKPSPAKVKPAPAKPKTIKPTPVKAKPAPVKAKPKPKPAPVKAKPAPVKPAPAPMKRAVANKIISQPPSEQGWQKPIPLTFSIDYTLATDYIFRGINFSEYRRSWGQSKNEGREKLNHQLTAGVELDLGKAGRVGYSAWFEWFGGQRYLTPEDGGKNLQEVDHTAYYGYTFEKLGLDIEVGFIWYMFPRVASGDGASTQEIYVLQSFDDSVLWRALGFKNVKKPIFNPYLLMAWDIDLASCGMYSEFGISHDFALGELGMKNTPILKDITVTPTWSIGWDHNWLNKVSLDWPASNPGQRANNSSHLDFMNWGLEVNFDLKSALKIPDKYCGEMYIKGFLNFSDAIAENFLNDEFYGGVSVGFSW